MSTTEARLSLGIRRMPASVGRVHPGKVYAVCVDTPAHARSLVFGLVDDAVEQRQRVTVTLGPQSQPWRPQLEKRGTGRLVEHERLTVLEHDSPAADQAVARDARRLVEELDHFGAAGSLLILVEADGLLSSIDGPADPQELAWLRRWAAESLTPVLLFVCGKTGMQERIARLQAAGAALAGAARLQTEHSQTALQLDDWHGVVSAHRHYLRDSSDGAYELAVELPPRHFADVAQLRAAKDHDQVFITRATTLADIRPPADWIVVETTDELLRQADTMSAASCLLEAGASSDFRKLARTVYALRHKVGSGVKIVVREGSQRLRTAQALVLQNIGANAVIESGSNLSRLLTVFESLRDQLYMRALPDDLDEALDALEPPREQGYLPAAAFCAECERALVKALPNGTECVLARLFLLPDLDLSDALTHCRTRRGGDLFSCDSRSVYVFLYGCWQHDVAATLARLFTLPIPELFVGHIEHNDAIAIRRELSNLGERARTLHLPDFSPIVASAAPPLSLSVDADESPTVRLESVERQRSVTPAPLTLRTQGAA